MKSLMTVLGVVLLSGAAISLAAETESREGYVMPEACKSRDAAKGGPEAHTTRCALELDCVVTGYGLLVGGDFFEFDDKGDRMALDYFRETTKTDHHLVKVVGDFSGPETRVETLEPVNR